MTDTEDVFFLFLFVLLVIISLFALAAVGGVLAHALVEVAEWSWNLKEGS